MARKTKIIKTGTTTPTVKLAKTQGAFVETPKKIDNFDEFKVAMKKAGFKVGNSFDASMTLVAIKTFQKLNGLKITHELDTITKQKLGL